MNSKKWTKIFVIFTLSSIVFIGLVNYIVDPLWIFNHSNNFNKLQYGFNERLLKSYYIKYRENILDNKDTLLLGASTATYFNEKISLSDDFALFLFSDGILEHLPGKDMAEQEAKMLAVINECKGDFKKVKTGLNLHHGIKVPDDIAVLSARHSTNSSRTSG